MYAFGRVCVCARENACKNVCTRILKKMAVKESVCFEENMYGSVCESDCVCERSVCV